MPDILVKGGDYTLDNVVGSKEVIGAGGKVELLKFHDGYSSTNYIDKIKKTLAWFSITLQIISLPYEND